MSNLLEIISAIYLILKTLKNLEIYFIMEFYNLSKMEQNFGRWNGQSVNLHQIKQRKSKQTFIVQLPAEQVNKRRLYKNKDKFK